MTNHELRSKADHYAFLVSKKIEPDCIILYGSVARDQANLDSDIDILVIGGNLEPNWFKRLNQLSRLVNGNRPIEAIGYTRAESAGITDHCVLADLCRQRPGARRRAADVVRRVEQGCDRF